MEKEFGENKKFPLLLDVIDFLITWLFFKEVRRRTWESVFAGSDKVSRFQTAPYYWRNGPVGT